MIKRSESRAVLAVERGRTGCLQALMERAANCQPLATSGSSDANPRATATSASVSIFLSPFRNLQRIGSAESLARPMGVRAASRHNLSTERLPGTGGVGVTLWLPGASVRDPGAPAGSFSNLVGAQGPHY
jgi:hypothetical protein